MKLLILLPAYNEENDLSKLVKSIVTQMSTLSYDYRVIVVDDGSQDHTAQIAEELSQQYPLTLIRHSSNRGYGSALSTAFSYSLASGQDDDILITMDCDNTHPPDYISNIIGKIQDQYEVVVASRYHPQGGQIGVSLRRKLLSLTSNSLLRVLFPIKGVRDYTCGYRGYRLGVLKHAKEYYGDSFIQSKGFTAATEILLKLRQFGIHAGEIPLVLRYDLKDGASKMKVAKTVLAYLGVIWIFLRRRMKR